MYVCVPILISYLLFLQDQDEVEEWEPFIYAECHSDLPQHDSTDQPTDLSRQGSHDQPTDLSQQG